MTDNIDSGHPDINAFSKTDPGLKIYQHALDTAVALKHLQPSLDDWRLCSPIRLTFSGPPPPGFAA
jgi:hypothetical protein